MDFPQMPFLTRLGEQFGIMRPKPWHLLPLTAVVLAVLASVALLLQAAPERADASFTPPGVALTL